MEIKLEHTRREILKNSLLVAGLGVIGLPDRRRVLMRNPQRLRSCCA